MTEPEYASVEMTEPEYVSGLAVALAKAQGVMKSAILNKVNPHFRSRYADLASVLDAIRQPLSDNGLAITQTVHKEEGGLILRTTLHHTSGEAVDSEYPLPWPAKPQELGSALTYARRYSISAMVCIAADEDDDANAANGNGKVIEVGPPVNPAQVNELQFALKEANSNLEDFLIWVRIAHPQVMELTDIPAAYFKIALDKVKQVAKIKQRKAEEVANVE